VFQKSDAKIQITITTAYPVILKYPLSDFKLHLSYVNVANVNKIRRIVSERQLFKNGTQKQKFAIWKIPISLLTAQDNAPAHRAGDTVDFLSRNAPSEHLSFSDQISAISKACYYHSSQLRCIRPYLDSTRACTIATAIVHSKLDYCNSLYTTTYRSLRLPASNWFRTLLPVQLLKLLNPVTSLLSYALFTGSK